MTGTDALNRAAWVSVPNDCPGPLTKRTTLGYSSKGGRLMIQVYDEKGRRVRTVVNQPTPAYSCTVDVDMGDQPAGVYSVRLQNEGIQQVRNVWKVR